MNRPTNIYPCNGRDRTPRPYVVQDGYHEHKQGETPVKIARHKEITSEFKPGCQYDRNKTDPKCQGCGHRNIKCTTTGKEQSC